MYVLCYGAECTGVRLSQPAECIKEVNIISPLRSYSFLGPVASRLPFARCNQFFIPHHFRTTGLSNISTTDDYSLLFQNDARTHTYCFQDCNSTRTSLDERKKPCANMTKFGALRSATAVKPRPWRGQQPNVSSSARTPAPHPKVQAECLKKSFPNHSPPPSPSIHQFIRLYVHPFRFLSTSAVPLRLLSIFLSVILYPVYIFFRAAGLNGPSCGLAMR